MNPKIAWKSCGWNAWQCYDVMTGRVYGYIRSNSEDYPARALNEDLGSYISQAHAQQAVEKYLEDLLP